MVFAGFGRPGARPLLAELQRRAPQSIDSIVIVDVCAAERVLDFDDQIGFIDGFEKHVIDGDASSLAVWSKVEALHDFTERAPAFSPDFR